jgi:phosphopantothenoylcysteine decarboxylase/phosphopantothenate--cysteine ligase
MGYAIVRQAVRLGANVTLVSGLATQPVPAGAEVVRVTSTAEMAKAVKEHFRSCHCLIMAAAPSDFTPKGKPTSKLKRREGEFTLELEPTEDILASVTKHKGKRLVVGFALETDDAVANARKKLKDKRLDLVVLNSPGDDTGFEADTNRVTLLAPGRRAIEWPLMSKDEVAHKLLAKLAGML